MFEARLAKAAVLKRAVDAIKELCKEVNIDVSSDGIAMQSMDTSHVCLVAFQLLASGFERFECDAPSTLGVNLENLAKLLRCADGDDAVTLRGGRDGDDLLSLVIESEEGARMSNVDMKLMCIDSDHMHIPEQDSSVRLSLSAARYQRIMRDLLAFGDALRITADAAGDGRTVRFGTSGEVGSVTMDVAPAAGDEQDGVEIAAPVAASFALRYMNTFAKATPLAARVQLDLVQDMPIRVSYAIEDHGWLRFFLAPKMDDDDDDGGEDGGGAA